MAARVRLASAHPGRTLCYLVFAAVAAAYAWKLRWVCDDSYISFRYARNFADGNGLVFNLGERVEGYTNFLWVLEMAFCHRLGFSLPFAAQAFSLLLSACVFALTVRVALAGPVRALRHFTAFVALALLASNRHVAMWATSGLETRQFTLLVLLSVYLAHAARGRSNGLFVASIALGGAALTRPEAPLILASIIVWYWLDSHLHRRFSWAALGALALPCAGVIFTHLLWRHSYYGEWLPNTYYAKVVRPWPDAGMHYVFAIAVEAALYLALPVALLGAVFRYLHQRDTLHLLSLLIAVPYTIHIVTIGGDHFEFRVFDFLWPLLAIAVADGLAFAVLLLQLHARRRGWVRPRLIGRIAGGSAAAGLVLYGSVLQIAHYSLTYDTDDEQAELPNTEVTPQNFPLAYALPLLPTLTPLYNASMTCLNKHFIAWRLLGHQLFARRQRRNYEAYARPDRRRLPGQVIMAYNCMGIMPYGFPEVTFIDTLGLVDRTVARSGGAPNAERRMAHDRSPPPGYLVSRGVNMDIRPAASSREEALRSATYAVQLAPGLWMPFEAVKPFNVQTSFTGFPLYRNPVVSGAAPAGTTAIYADRLLRGVASLGDFDVGDDGWVLRGPIIERDATVRQGVTGYTGAGYLTSYGPRGDWDRGFALSTDFAVGQGDALAFKIAGGAAANVGVQLVVNDAVVDVFRGANSESFEWVLVDLARYAGRRARLRLFDDDDGPWGHVMIDHLVLMRP